MSQASESPGAKLAREVPAPTPQAPPAAVAFHYTQSESFVDLLDQLGASLLVSTYQANKLLVVRVQTPLSPGGRGAGGEGVGISTLVRTFERPMGIAADERRLALGTRSEVWLMRNAPDIAGRIEPAGRHDACYLPRSCHVTGDIGIHEMAWAHSPLSLGGRGAGGEGDELWIVSTRFSCLATLSPDYSFVPRWRPPFISALAAEDRCHLNGLAIVDGQPRYVTALGTTDTRDGWREDKPRGGCLIDIESGEFVARGLSMPHSPRRHDGRLLLLESGNGRLVDVDLATGRWQSVTELPGFTRGLALVGPYAFIGLSKIREKSAMSGVPLAQRRNELKCGVAAIDLRSGQTIGLLEFQTAVEEIFDVQLLSGLRFPEVLGFQKDDIQHTFVVPPNA